jgi:hypothetical protein
VMVSKENTPLKKFAQDIMDKLRLLNPIDGRKPQQGWGNFPGQRSNHLGAQLVLLVVNHVKHGLLGHDTQLGPLIHAEIHPGLLGGEQVHHVLLVGDGAGKVNREDLGFSFTSVTSESQVELLHAIYK